MVASHFDEYVFLNKSFESWILNFESHSASYCSYPNKRDIININTDANLVKHDLYDSPVKYASSILMPTQVKHDLYDTTYVVLCFAVGKSFHGMYR